MSWIREVVHRWAAAGDEPDPADVLADVEATLRRAVPLPHHAPHVSDIDDLLQLIDVAEDAYERLIEEHVDHAEKTLALHTDRRRLTTRVSRTCLLKLRP